MPEGWKRVIGCGALALAVVVFGRVGWVYLAHPVEAAARMGLHLDTPAAANSIRVAVGGFHLGTGIIALLGLARTRWISDSLTFLVVITGTVVAVRVSGGVIAGFDTLPRLPTLLEIVSLCVFSAALWIQTDDRKE